MKEQADILLVEALQNTEQVGERSTKPVNRPRRPSLKKLLFALADFWRFTGIRTLAFANSPIYQRGSGFGPYRLLPGKVH